MLILIISQNKSKQRIIISIWLDIYVVIIPLLLILPKLSDYARSFKDKNNILMSFGLNDDKLLGNYETIWSNIEDLHNFKLNTLIVFNDRYIKTQLRSYDYEFYTILCG